MSSHTPTPWVYRRSAMSPDDLLFISTDADEHIAETYSAANAAFIVQACNSHEALVEAINHQLTAVTDFIIAVDKLMSGPPAPIRGNKLAQLITALQDDTDLLRAELAVAKGA